MNPWSYVQNLLAGWAPVPGGRLALTGASSARPLLGAALSERLGDNPLIFALPDNDRAERFVEELDWHRRTTGLPPLPVVFFPGLEVDPYRGLSPHPAVVEGRCRALAMLLEGARILVTTPAALLERLPTPEAFLDRVVDLRLSRQFSLPDLRKVLLAGGYTLEDPVTEPGEFAVRGGVLDVYPPNLNHPLRVEFFGDYIDSMRTFDPETQRSVSSMEMATVVPVTLWPHGREVAESLLERLREEFSGERFGAALLEIREQVEGGVLPPGGEFLLPLLEKEEGSLWDYLGEKGAAIFPGGDPLEWAQGFRIAQDKLCRDALGRGQPALSPDVHLLSLEEFGSRMQSRTLIQLDELVSEGGLAIHLPCTAPSSFLGNFTGLAHYLAAAKESVVLVVSNEGRRERIRDICREYGVECETPSSFHWADLETGAGRRVVLTLGPLQRGLRLPELGLAILGNEDIFPAGKRRKRAARAGRLGSVSAFFSDFKDLKPGDYVVHVDHGVGIFRGLQKISAGGLEQEFAFVEYAERAKLFVPVERLDLVQKYSGGEGIEPSLDRLGGTSWQKARARVKKALQDMADELLSLYARRVTATGYAFGPDDNWSREFDGLFEFEETEDQLRAIEEIRRDMESTRPMDRLLCGDVGFGKTEVAMRAAFKATNGGKQVAILAPTTVLAFQHYNTFRSRFASFPTRIELVSRFRSAAEQKTVLSDLEDGKVDIIVGTHRLLSKDVAFRDLGLLIVDEEQRFGVTHKERIKKMRADVDVLTLTATPIPRTLYMSVVGIRDVSVIETPPKDRLAIQTQVVREDDGVIRDAIRRELERRGQVYYVYNRVETIYAMAARLRELVPEARIAVAHGQMKEKELESIILDFVGYRYDVLLSTTIIETGIDIPLVNTIIIHDAHRFGLAQLYQLRGRVGRSNRRAYAWLLVPSLDHLGDVARKRLAAIRDFSELGAGFRLAALDMEIRGAGNILGAEQHGHIDAVGFEMYCRLMDEAVREMKGETWIPPEKVKINLQVKLRIPETYVPDETQRLQLYKRIASSGGYEELDELREEVQDRFGAFPEVVDYLFEFARLKLLALQLQVLSIDRRQDVFRIQFTPGSPVDPDVLVRKIREGEQMQFSPDGVLTARIPFITVPDMFSRLKKVLVELVPHARIP